MNGISEKTPVALGVVISLCVGIATLSLWISSQLATIKRSLDIGWTLHDQREWARQIKSNNPTFVIPDANEIFWGRRTKKDTAAATKDSTLTTIGAIP